jgi:predicted DCC family thiol-disulfide oxidoreductase YuxK
MPTEFRHLLLFDGVCHLCDHTVQWVLAHDRTGLVHFCPIQSETGRRLYSQHGLDPEHPGSMLLLTPGGALEKSDAALELAALMGPPCSWLRLLRIIPRPLRDAVYDLVSRNRYRLFGRREACWLPRPEWRQRFLDQA